MLPAGLRFGLGWARPGGARLARAMLVGAALGSAGDALAQAPAGTGTPAAPPSAPAAGDAGLRLLPPPADGLPAEVIDPDPRPQRLVFEVAAPFEPVIVGVAVTLRRGGETRVIRLSDDGSGALDTPWDGVWTGADDGPWVRPATVRIAVAAHDGRGRLAWSGLVATDDRLLSLLSWQLRDGPEGLRALRVAAAWPEDTVAVPEGLGVWLGLGWGCLLVAWVVGMVQTGRRGPA